VDLITVRIPGDLVCPHAHWWYGDTAGFVLNEEVNAWLEEQKISPDVKVVHIKHLEPHSDPEIQYEITFRSVREATLFKLRWF
jgi:hypothetical protein